jgi:hypothetical protein
VTGASASSRQWIIARIAWPPLPDSESRAHLAAGVSADCLGLLPIGHYSQC